MYGHPSSEKAPASSEESSDDIGSDSYHIYLIGQVKTGAAWLEFAEGQKVTKGTLEEIFSPQATPAVDPSVHEFFKQENPSYGTGHSHVEQFASNFGWQMITKTDIGGMILMRVECKKVTQNVICGRKNSQDLHSDLKAEWRRILGANKGSLEDSVPATAQYTASKRDIFVDFIGGKTSFPKHFHVRNSKTAKDDHGTLLCH